MRLLHLTSENPRFQNISFHDGLNIIIGKKITHNQKDTINGVGKTLAIELIDYLLGGSNQRISSILQETDTLVNLQFEHNGEVFQVGKDGRNIYFNEEKIKHKEYLQLLNDLIPEKPFSFRDFLIRFVRRAYNEPTMQLPQEDKYHNNIVNAFLLGLNTEYIEKKRELAKKNDALRQIIQALKQLKSEVDKEEILEIQEELKKIERDLATFQIAEDYYEIEKEIERLTEQIKETRNQIAYYERELRLRREIIEVNQSVDIDIDRIERIYKEAEFFLGDKVVQHLEAVKEFHETLFRNRKKSAEEDIRVISRKLEIEEKRLKNLDELRAQKMHYLKGKGALDEYHSLIEKREELRERLQQLRAKEEEIENFEEEKSRLKLEIDQFQVELLELKKSLKGRFEQINQDFRGISTLFYEKPGLLDIDINENMQAKHLYKIEPKIQADDSSGINMMKIFIYDMLLYKYNPEIIGFVAHDNVLFDVVDERQIATAFQYIKDHLSQYICSINDTKFEHAKEYFEGNLQDYVVLELNERKKLFGVDF